MSGLGVGGTSSDAWSECVSCGTVGFSVGKKNFFCKKWSDDQFFESGF